MLRILVVALVAGCVGTDVVPGWVIEDPAGDAPAGADILHVSIDDDREARVEVLLAAPLTASGQVQVLLETAGGFYLLSATDDEAHASYALDPCDGCSPQEQHANVGTGSLDERRAEWTFTREHAFTGRVVAQTLGERDDGPCLYDWVGESVPEPPAPRCPKDGSGQTAT